VRPRAGEDDCDLLPGPLAPVGVRGQSLVEIADDSLCSAACLRREVRFGDLLLQLRELRAGRVEISSVERALQALDRAEQPRRLPQHAAEVVLDVAGRRAVHTRDPDVAAARTRADAILDPFPFHLD